MHEAIALDIAPILAATEEYRLLRRIASDPEAWIACLEAGMQARFFGAIADRIIFDELAEWYASHAAAPGRDALRVLVIDPAAVERVDDLDLAEQPTAHVPDVVVDPDIPLLVRALRERSALRHKKASAVRDRVAKGWVTF